MTSPIALFAPAITSTGPKSEVHDKPAAAKKTLSQTLQAPVTGFNERPPVVPKTPLTYGPPWPSKRAEPTRPEDRAMMQAVRAIPESSFNYPKGVRAEVVKTVSFRDMTALLDVILSGSKKPDVLAFGEAHLMPGFSGPQASFMFQDKFVQPLAEKHGYKNFVYEALPADVNPALFSELAGRTDSADPFGRELKSIFDNARKFGITLAGSNMTLPEKQDRMLLAQLKPELTEAAHFLVGGRLIWKHTIEEADKFRAREEKVVLYSGGMHVPPFRSFDAYQIPLLNLEYREQIFDTYENTFGKDFIEAGDDYMAVVLYTPSTRCFFLNKKAEKGLPVEEEVPTTTALWYLDHHGLIPPAGYVNLVKVTSQDGKRFYYNMVFPFAS